MSRKPRYVVIRYTRSHCVEGVYGPFADREAAETFGKASDAPRYRVAQLCSPNEFLFGKVKEPAARKRRAT